MTESEKTTSFDNTSPHTESDSDVATRSKTGLRLKGKVCAFIIILTVIIVIYNVVLTFIAQNHSGPLTTQKSLAQSGILMDEESVIEIVRQWYKSKSWTVPERIVIVEKGPELWRISAGPEIKEAGFLVDPVKKTVLRFFPGD